MLIIRAKTIAITDGKFSPMVKSATVGLIARSDMVSFVDSLVAPLSLVCYSMILV